MPTTRSQARIASIRTVPARVMRAKSRAAASGVSKVDPTTTRPPQTRSTSRVISPTQNPKPLLETHHGSRQHKPAGQSKDQPANQPAVESKPAKKRCLMPANKRKAHAISRLRELADGKISHLEDVTNQAERRFKWKEHFGSLAQNSQGANHALHPEYTLPDLIHGDTIYKYKTSSPFVGMSVSPGTLTQINGQDYVEYRVLVKPRF